MGIKVLFFGATAVIAGHREIKMEWVDGLSVRQVHVHLLNEYPKLSKHKLLVSINQQYSTGSEITRDGDELAIFTVVSGG